MNQRHAVSISFPLLGTWLIAAVAGTIFYAGAWPDAPTRTPDSYYYTRMASDLQDGRLDALYLRGPGFPLFLLLTGTPDGTGRVLVYVQLVLHFVCVLLLADLLRRFGTPTIFTAAFFVLGFLPIAVQSASHVLTEILTQFLLVVGVSGLVRWLRWGGKGWLVASGIAFAFVGITRPTFQLIAPFLVVILVGLLAAYRPIRAHRRRIAIGASVILLCSGIVEGGFIAHNRIRFGYLGTVPAAGFHLCTKTWTMLERLPDEHAVVRDILISHRDREFLLEHSPPVTYIERALPDLEKATGMSEAQVSLHLQKLNLLLIAKAPLHYILDVAASMAYFWMPGVDMCVCFGSRRLLAVWSALQLVIVGVFFFVTCRLLGAVLLWRKLDLSIRNRWVVPGMVDSPARLAAMVIIAGMLAYTMVTSTVAQTGEPRYRQPLNLLMWFLIALEFDVWRRMLQSIRPVDRSADECQPGRRVDGLAKDDRTSVD